MEIIGLLKVRSLRTQDLQSKLLTWDTVKLLRKPKVVVVGDDTTGKTGLII
jgi:hypothetical protein